MRFVKIREQFLHVKWDLCFHQRASGSEAKHIARLARLYWPMAVLPRIEFVTEVPFLKNVLAERPERAVPREHAFDVMTQYFTRVRVKAVNEFKANIAMEKRRFERVQFILLREG